MTDAQKAQIERINELSQLARAAWFSLLAYLVFVGITLLGVEDADFFLDSRQTQLPLVGVQIPTAKFFLAAPILGAALYTYLHLFLIKLWEAHGSAPTTDADPTHHWLVNDFVLIQQGDYTARTRPLAWLTSLVTRLLVWVAGPLVLFGLWWRSMPAHNEGLTLVIAACLLVTLYVGFTSWWSANVNLRRPWRTPWQGWWRRPAGVLVAVLVLLVTWLRTEGGLEHYANLAIDGYERVTGKDVFAPSSGDEGEKDAQTVQEEWVENYPLIVKTGWFTFGEDHWLLGIWLNAENTWNPLAATDLANGALGWPPEGWRDRDYAERRYRESWCDRRHLDVSTCDLLNQASEAEPADLETSRDAWCGSAQIPADACVARFTAVEDVFQGEWQQEREAYLSHLEDPDQVGRDLRNADLRNAFLADADLSMARLEGADLSEARLEGADLSWARLEGANLSEARLEGANLWLARLERANLSDARLERANLILARLEGANLSDARLEGADLVGARLEGADLVGARLEGADLSGARLEGADLSWARLEGADLGDARLEGADLSEARLEGAVLGHARLEGADLVGARLEGADLSEARLEGADLVGARLEGADLRWARLEGADLQYADFRKSNWALAGASNRASPAHYADFRAGQDLTQAQLEDLIGNRETLLPDTPAPDTSKPFYVWSCWATPPEGFDALVDRVARTTPIGDPETIRADFLCPKGQAPQKTGTPLAIDAPYPPGHPLGERD